LDTELKNMGKPVDPKPNPPLEFGSRSWRFSFFGNKGLFGKGIYTLFIASNEAQDSRNFDIDEVFSSGDLHGGFKGETRGAFTTTKKVGSDIFATAICDIVVTRTASGTLTGSIQLQKIVADGVFDVRLLLPGFRDETIGLGTGSISVRGQLRK